jgi:periplasmic divalent cation tolerance protein
LTCGNLITYLPKQTEAINRDFNKENNLSVEARQMALVILENAERGEIHMDTDYLIVLVTVPTFEDGRKIAQELVGQKLAACVNILPGITSIYSWEGEVCEDAELQLVIKTRGALFSAISDFVKEAHPYDVPEVIAMPISGGSTAYLDWVDAVTQNS